MDFELFKSAKKPATPITISAMAPPPDITAGPTPALPVKTSLKMKPDTLDKFRATTSKRVLKHATAGVGADVRPKMQTINTQLTSDLGVPGVKAKALAGTGATSDSKRTHILEGELGYGPATVSYQRTGPDFSKAKLKASLEHEFVPGFSGELEGYAEGKGSKFNRYGAKAILKKALGSGYGANVEGYREDGKGSPDWGVTAGLTKEF